jgi:hypothetical protein
LNQIGPGGEAVAGIGGRHNAPHANQRHGRRQRSSQQLRDSQCPFCERRAAKATCANGFNHGLRSSQPGAINRGIRSDDPRETRFDYEGRCIVQLIIGQVGRKFEGEW